MKAVSIILADDHPIFLEGLRMTIEDIPNVKVVAEAKNGEVLLEKAHLHKPDVVITDIAMPVMDGIEATKKLRKEFPSMGILALSMHSDHSSVTKMLDAGANGYLAKNADTSEISDAIDAAYMLRPYFCKTSSLQLCKTIADKQKFSTQLLKSLSPKEITVIQYICKDFTAKEIAYETGMNHRTVEAYRGRIHEKLGVSGTAGIVVFAMQTGLFKPS